MKSVVIAVGWTYIADVFVDTDYRRRGIASMMLDVLHAHPDIARVKRWMLATHDMQPVYRQHGYEDLNETIMMRLDAESDDREPLL